MPVSERASQLDGTGRSCASAPTDGSAATDGGAARLSGPGRVIVAGMRAWQVARAGRPSPCRFVPTCSTYGVEAVEARGVWRGVGLTVRRILRCNPWGPYGYDPVPVVGITGRPTLRGVR